MALGCRKAAATSLYTSQGNNSPTIPVQPIGIRHQKLPIREMEQKMKTRRWKKSLMPELIWLRSLSKEKQLQNYRSSGTQVVGLD